MTEHVIEGVTRPPRRKVLGMALAVALVLSTAASVACSAADHPPKTEAGADVQAPSTVTLQKKGDASFVLADAKGFTLYYFAGDAADASMACTGACASNWAPLSVSSTNVEKPAALPLTLDTVKRGDGTLHVRYGGRPLYRSTLDKAPGDRNGQDQESWTVAFVELACECGTH